MELREIVKRFAEGIPEVDSSTTTRNCNPRKETKPYLKGAPNLTEVQFVSEISEWWASKYPSELPRFSKEHLEYLYPGNTTNENGSKSEYCDLVINPNASDLETFEWAVEVKYLRLAGNNGMNNDYAISKALSPFMKDRSALHDAQRLKASNFANKKALIIYSFCYDKNSYKLSEEICKRIEGEGDPEDFIHHHKNGKKGKRFSDLLFSTLKSVDKIDFVYSAEPLVNQITDQLISDDLWQKSNGHCIEWFRGANRHPCGMKGLVAGWEITSD